MKNLCLMLLAAVFAAFSVSAAENAAPAEKPAKAVKKAAKKPAKKANVLPADGGMKASTTATPRFNPKAKRKNAWHKRYDAKLKQIADYKNDVDMVWIGDSITHYWDTDALKNKRKFGGLATYNKYFSKYKVINLGYGGDRTQHALWIAAKSPYLNNIKPKMVMVMIGTNNIARNRATPAAAAAGVTKVVEALRVRLPETKILLFGVFPREASAKHIYRKHIKDINAVISKLADDKNVFYCDITDKFLDKNGTLSRSIMPDLLHPNDAGYEIWAQAMMPYVEKFVGKK